MDVTEGVLQLGIESLSSSTCNINTSCHVTSGRTEGCNCSAAELFISYVHYGKAEYSNHALNAVLNIRH
jgi:hypothetical protein